MYNFLVDRISTTPLVLRRSRVGVFFRRAWLLLRLIFVIAILIPLTVRSQLAPANTDEQIRAYTRAVEFDYGS